MNDLVKDFDEQFARLYLRACALIEIVSAEILYRQPRAAQNMSVRSCGEHLLRNAGAIEQTFGGLTANLWDDPFEWTLPENLATPERMLEYMREVEQTRRRAFETFTGDHDLSKKIVVPSGEIKTLNALLLETLARAAHHQGGAYAALRLFSDAHLPRV
jgi:uncharacterized damage-inducible protein DinB